MAKQIAGPNLNMIKSGISSNLSTTDLINEKASLNYYSSSNHPFEGLNNAARAISLLNQKGIQLGTDYSSFSNFVHFGSAAERLSHFKEKVEDIHYHRDQADIIQKNYSSTQQFQSESIDFHIDAASTIISEFDEYDRFLYFESSDHSWPKNNLGELYPATSSAATTWYDDKFEIAEDYDLENQNRIINTLPAYIREEEVNNPVIAFCDMLGHYYDNLLLYADGISQKHNADNRLNVGVSRDLVGDVLRGFGVKLYESQLKNTDLIRLYIGELYPTGSENVDTIISASNSIPSVKDQIDETNKRIYHNLSHILQTKGTKRGLRALINSFGIPSGILPIKEFGGINIEEGQNFGPAEFVLNTLDKVRTDNTGSYISGSTLSPSALTFKPDGKYTQDIHIVEVGWSTNQQKDNFITGSLSSTFNIDEYIGDPRQRFDSNYSDLVNTTNSILTGSQDNTLYDFLRLLKYFDNQVFSMVKDFVPARTSVRRGAVVKPHILERSKVGVGFMSQSLHQISSSIDVVEVTGGPSEIWDDHSTTYTQYNPTPQGYVTESIDYQKAKIDGELGGSVIEVSDGEMNPDNDLKKASATIFNYDTTKYTDKNNFDLALVHPGKMLLYFLDPFAPPPLDGGGGPIGGGGTTYSQSLSVVFLQNTAIDVNHVQVAVQNGSTYVASANDPDDSDVIYTTATLTDGDTVTIHLSADGQEFPPADFDVEILQGSTVVASDASSFGNAFTSHTYTVPTLSAQGTSVTFNLKVR